MHAESRRLLRLSRSGSGGDLGAGPLTVPIPVESTLWADAASR